MNDLTQYRDPAYPNLGLLSPAAGVYRTWADYQGLDVFIGDVLRLNDPKDPDSGTYLSRELAGFWYTFGDRGLPRYYLFNCKVTDDFFDILTTTGGTFAQPSKATTRTIGRGSLDLENLVFHYHTKEHGRGSWLLKLSQPGPVRGSGSYYQPDLTGSGFSIRAYSVAWTSNPLISCYWYTYNQVGQQLWFLCSGFPDALRVYQYLGGRFGYMGATETDVGSATIDLDAGRFTYNIKAVGIVAKGEQQLVRII